MGYRILGHGDHPHNSDPAEHHCRHCGRQCVGVHRRLPGEQTASSLQLPARLVGRERPVRVAPSHAHGHGLRDPGPLAVRFDDVRYLGGVRRAQLHGFHPEPVHDQRRSLLRHHSAARLRGEAHPAQDVPVRRLRLAHGRLHLLTAAPRTRQLPRNRRNAVHRLPGIRLPDLCDARIILHSALGHDRRLPEDFPGRSENSARRAGQSESLAGAAAAAAAAGAGGRSQDLRSREAHQRRRFFSGRIEPTRIGSSVHSQPTGEPGGERCRHHHRCSSHVQQTQPQSTALHTDQRKKGT